MGVRQNRAIPQDNNLRANIEAMAARGLTPHQIRDHLKCDLFYVYEVSRWVTHAGAADDSMPFDDDDQRYVAACMSEGGFPAAVQLPGKGVVHVSGSGRPWAHLPKVKAAA